jgi:hypothetical protein
MELREALIRQSPSLELQRAAQAEIARLDAVVMLLTKEVQELQSELAEANQILDDIQSAADDRRFH